MQFAQNANRILALIHELSRYQKDYLVAIYNNSKRQGHESYLKWLIQYFIKMINVNEKRIIQRRRKENS